MRRNDDTPKGIGGAAGTRSCSTAEEQLGRAQSVVSTAIASLAIGLGVEHVDRSAKLPGVTEGGKEKQGRERRGGKRGGRGKSR